LILALSWMLPGAVCINEYGKNILGYEIDTNEQERQPSRLILELTRHPEHDAIRKSDLGPEPLPEADFKVRNDYAAKLIRQGKVKRAIEMLDSIEKEHPGEYIVAANLGTAYELGGDVDRALRWISEGYKRNPDSHLATEWLHIRILEVKRELAKDPAWLKTHSVLDFDFGTDAVPVFPAKWGKMGQEAVVGALRHQLHERLAFVSPPEPIVGELLGVYADYAAVHWPVDYAIPLYDLALSFKPAHADLLEMRRAKAASQLPSVFDDLPIEGIGLIAVIILILILFFVRFNRTSAARL
jgi:tetratricopeptide (TPR) repeat protein